ncbi:MAG: sensor histidine kinase [Paenibacillaceae bacterium]
MLNGKISLYSWIRNSKIKSRLIVSFLFLSILPLFITSTFTYQKTSEAIHAKSSTYSLQILDQVRNEINRENKKLEYLSDQIMTNNLVQTNLLNATKLDMHSVMDTYYEVNQTFSGRKLLDHIKSLQIYNSTVELVYDLGYDQLKEEDISQLTKMITEHDGNDVWTHVTTKNDVDCIILGRQIHSRENWLQPIGYIFIAVKESFYSRDIYGDVDMGEGADLFILDPLGNVLSARNPKIQFGNKHENSGLIKQIVSNEAEGKRSFSMTIQRNGYLVAYSYDTSARWYLISTIPDAYLNKETRNVLPYILYVCALCFVFSLLLTFIISTSISRPLKLLTQTMKQVAGGNLNVSIEDSNKDEIGFLTGKFNSMVEQLRNSIDHSKEEQIKKREIELQMLQAQINPHFLFNTLNSLKWTALLNNDVSVSSGLTSLAELLRSTIVDKKELILLRDELKNVENYIVIQRLRYGTSFEVEYQINERLRDSSILKFILQPIVENSIIHGLDPKEYDSKIIISAEELGTYMRITIRDNGKGMDVQQINNLVYSGSKSKNRLSNIGISNVNERIKLNYGEEFGLTIESEVGKGTSIIMMMPLLGLENMDND